MARRETNLTTRDGLRVYDLDTQAGEFWAVAGPSGYDVDAIDPDWLADGFRWVSDAEWAALNGNGRVISAEWTGEHYSVACMGWFSDNGNDWVDAMGDPVTSGDFRDSEIHLEGGPRNGQTV